MAGSATLLKDLRHEVRLLEADLRAQAPDMLRAAWHDAQKAGLTAATWDQWRDDQIAKSASAWAMATVFVRYCEDNELISVPFLAGTGDRLALARERQEAHFHRHPERADRDWIVAALDSLSMSAATLQLFDGMHGLMRRLPISHEAAKSLISFWRHTDESGQLVRDLSDPTLEALFLGDLYADLSEYARKGYALVQTPGFVADLIVERTVSPAIAAFGVRELRIIDPVCGSGTFLVRAFPRILQAHIEAEPGVDRWQHIRQTLASIHGVDKNPLAVVICRFRLLLVALATANARCLSDVPKLPLIIATGDSLIPREKAADYSYRQLGEDISNYAAPEVNLLGRGSYHAVIGNPPYTAVQDQRASAAYRSLYSVCRGRYALTVPFIVRFLNLAQSDDEQSGFIGLIVANSFMKREFGRPLVEDFLRGVDITHILDTSGAYIPGHGTPTVILLGRARQPSGQHIRAALGLRGEPTEPADPAAGVVWTALADQIDHPGSESEWILVRDIDRERFAKHPWTLAGSSADDLLATLEDHTRLGALTARIGYYATTGSDDAFIVPKRFFQRHGAEMVPTTAVITGSDVRDWTAGSEADAFFPGDTERVIDIHEYPCHMRRLWPYRTELGSRRYYGALNLAETRRPWYSWHQVTRTPGAHPWSLVFSWVATLGHFALLRDNAAPLQSAPIIKLPDSAKISDFFGLLAALNSSTASFWLKQHSQSKGAPRADQLRAEEAWERIYEFTSTGLSKFPLPQKLPVERGNELDDLARRLTAVEPSTVCTNAMPTSKHLGDALAEHGRIRRRMIALQEELDWDVYDRYELITGAELVADLATVPELNSGERAFEIVMARRMAKGDLETQWFARHHSTPITEIPAHWPDAYKAVVARRIEFIKTDRNISLIERPEYKRRWQQPDTWEEKEAKALTSWLLDRCEDRSLWYGPDGQPRSLTVNNLADRLRSNADFVSVARLLAGHDADVASVLTGILGGEHVPYLAQFRYKGEGLVKRALWEQAWNLQREEDRTGQRLNIPVPRKYTSVDFYKQSYWRHRGKLDVAKERFISYPGAAPGGDESLLLGWAGWDHREQAYALITLITQRSTTDGWDTTRLTPLIAGLAETMPWVRQWHNDIDPAYGQSPADAYDEFLTTQRLTHHLTDQDLGNWSAPPPRRGRPPKKNMSDHGTPEVEQ